MIFHSYATIPEGISHKATIPNPPYESSDPADSSRGEADARLMASGALGKQRTRQGTSGASGASGARAGVA